MNTNASVDLKQLSALLRQGESPSPKYEEIGGSAVVAFKVRAGYIARVEIPSGGEKKAMARSEPGQSQRPESVLRDSRTPTEIRVMAALGKEPLDRHSLAGQFRHRSVSGALRKAISIPLQNECIEYTTPDKPRSSKQKCRLTERVPQTLIERTGGA
jgi:hypothetical protein